MDKNSANRFLPLATEPPGEKTVAAGENGRVSRASSRRSVSLDGLSERPSLRDLADAALSTRDLPNAVGSGATVSGSPIRRGQVRKHGDFAPDGTPQAERTARAERWVRAHNSITSLDDKSEPGLERITGSLGTGADSTPAPKAPLNSLAPAPVDTTPTVTPAPPDAGRRVPSAFVTASSLMRPAKDPVTGMSILWPTPAESVKSAPARAQAGRSSGRPPRPRSQQSAAQPSAPDAPRPAKGGPFKVPDPPTVQRRAPQQTVPSFDVDTGVWETYARPARQTGSDSLSAMSVDISPPRSLLADLRSVKEEEDDADSWLQTSAGRPEYDYSPPDSPTAATLGLRRKHLGAMRQADAMGVANASGRDVGVPVGNLPSTAMQWNAGVDDAQQAGLVEPGIAQTLHGSLTDDEADMYADEMPSRDPADSDVDDDLEEQDEDEEYVASDEDRIIAAAVDPAFEHTKIPLRAASRTSEIIDGTMAGSLWAGVDPSTLSHWAKLATGNFGVRVHSVDGDTNIAGMNSVQLKLDLQNTIRCTEPGCEAMVAPGKAARGATPAPPGLFLVHNVSIRTVDAWVSHQVFQVGRFCLIVFPRDHGDSTFVGTWAESTMPCEDLAIGLRERCKNASQVRTIFKEIDAESKGQGGKSFRRFLASLTVRPLVIKPRGSRGVEVTEYNVYTGHIAYHATRADGTQHVVTLSSERRRRLHDAILDLDVPDAMHGAAVRRSLDLKQYDCAICGSKSHPRGKCPALDIPKWGRASRKKPDRRGRKWTAPAAPHRPQAPQTSAPAQPQRGQRAGPSSRGKNGRTV